MKTMIDRAWALFAVLALAAPTEARSGEGLDIELNRASDVAGACEVAFLIRNGLGKTLNNFTMELALFGADGVFRKRVRINLAPLPAAKTTVTNFILDNEPCAGIYRVLINRFPACHSEDGEDLDCLAGLAVSSRAGVELFK